VHRLAGFGSVTLAGTVPAALGAQQTRPAGESRALPPRTEFVIRNA
jgi:hypothetical protein